MTDEATAGGHATWVLEPGRLAYDQAWDLMLGLVDKKAGSRQPQVLILLEHPPVLTLGRRAQEQDILVPHQELERQGIEVRRVERGGLVTYHGPGQLVAYPVFDLRAMELGPRELVHGMEEAMLRTLAEFGVQAQRHQGHPGVWLGSQKLASIGVAVRRGISYHGLALNVDPNLEHFSLINPCGLSGNPMTSLARLLERPVDLSEVQPRLLHHLCRVFGLEPRPWPLERARAWLTEA